MKLKLIRHCEPEIEAGICYGQLDISLSEKGKTNSKAIAETINFEIASDYKTRLIFSSDLIRAKYLSEQFNDNIFYDKRLREMNFGNWEGETWDNIPEIELNRWMVDFEIERVPGGESAQDMLYRCEKFLDELSKYFIDEAIVVTHAGVIRVMISILNKISVSEAFLQKIEFGEIIEFEF